MVKTMSKTQTSGSDMPITISETMSMGKSVSMSKSVAMSKSMSMSKAMSISKSMPVRKTVSVCKTMSMNQGCGMGDVRYSRKCWSVSVGNYWSNMSCVCNWSNWCSIGTCNYYGSWGTVCSTRFISFDYCSEAVSISNIVDSPSSSVDVMNGIRSFFIPMAITNFRTGVASTMSINNVVTKGIVSKSLRTKES